MERIEARNSLKVVYNISKSLIKLILKSNVLENNLKEKMLVEAYLKSITERMDKVLDKILKGDKFYEVEYFVLYKLILSILSKYIDKTEHTEYIVSDDYIKYYIKQIDGIKIRNITDMFDESFRKIVPNKKYINDMLGDVIYITVETSHGDFDYTLSFDNFDSKLLDLKVNFKVKGHSVIYGDLAEIE